MQALILDLDDSVGELPDAARIRLREWHDQLRFACRMSALRAFSSRLEVLLPSCRGPVFYGSGDFHHLGIVLIEHALARCRVPVRVLVFDNHPDNMRFPFAVHCGSWISRVASLPLVAQIDVVGITSRDIGWTHAWENRLWPLYRRRLHYWSIGVGTRWAKAAGLGPAFRNFESGDAMMAALLTDLERSPIPIYLSIDKDVLDPSEAVSNWDQGVLRVADLTTAIESLRGRMVGIDVNGEVSLARYPQRWKRLLSAIDAQHDPPASSLVEWQAQQHQVNLALLQACRAN